MSVLVSVANDRQSALVLPDLVMDAMKAVESIWEKAILCTIWLTCAHKQISEEQMSLIGSGSEYLWDHFVGHLVTVASADGEGDRQENSQAHLQMDNTRVRYGTCMEVYGRNPTQHGKKMQRWVLHHVCSIVLAVDATVSPKWLIYYILNLSALFDEPNSCHDELSRRMGERM